MNEEYIHQIDSALVVKIEPMTDPWDHGIFTDPFEWLSFFNGKLA